MVNELVSVTTYVLHGDGVKNLIFSMKTPEKLEFEYEGKQGELKRYGKDVTLIKIQVGFMSSVFFEPSPDLHIKTLSLVVPSANRSANAKSIPIKTFAVLTIDRTSLVGPHFVEGQIQTYETYALEGNAW